MTIRMTTVARWMSVLFAAIGLCAVTACRRSASPVRPTKPTTDNERTIQAMLSVHAHYLWPDRRFPDRVSVTSLEESARWLQDRAVAGGYNGFGWSRRRRAIGELAAACLDDDDYCALVLRVFRVDLHPILDKLRKRLRTVPKQYIAKEVADDPAVAGEKTDCFSQWSELLVTVSPATASHAAYTVDIQVPLDVATVAMAIDPQSWDHCSKFFCPPERTYLVSLGSDDTIGAMTSVQPPGTPYNKRALYESFTCALADCDDTTFQNLLGVTAARLASGGYYADYWLKQYLAGHVSGWTSDEATMLMDEGSVEAKPGTPPGTSVVHAEKRLLFENDVITGVVNGAFLLAEQELAGELAEMVCCQITSQPPTACPP